MRFVSFSIDDFVRFEPVTKAFLDYHFRYVRTTDQGLLQYNDARGNKFFFELSDYHRDIPLSLYECSFIVRDKRGG